MKLRTTSYLLIGLAAAVVLAGLVGLLTSTNYRRSLRLIATNRMVQAVQRMRQSADDVPLLPTPQVVVGTPEFYSYSQRYTYRQETVDGFPWRKLYLIDEETNHALRLGSDRGLADWGDMNDIYALWFFSCGTNCSIPSGLHAYSLTNGKDKLLYSKATYHIGAQIGGDWAAFGHHNGNGSSGVTLYAANLATHEVITLTRNMNTPMGAGIDLAFGISEWLAAWLVPPDTIVVYDLENRQELTRIIGIPHAFEDYNKPILMVTPGETVVTWTMGFGYDLITQSFFRIEQRRPLGADFKASLATMSRIHEKDRVLTWSFETDDGTILHIRAPLLDATPSTAPCIDGQNLVQNGGLESTTDHGLWQQSSRTTNLIVNDPPPGLATGGQWAIRLGRFNNAQQSIHQTVAIPSGVKGLTLSFAVRAHSWDLWGGDRLQLDLVDPLSGQSLLATPVQWTNVQLASGDWIPMQVAIQNWPGIDTPLHLVFRTQTDWAFPTDFTVDNIQLTTTCVRQ